MKKFVARQPIFDAEQNVFAYELLFRTGMEDFFNFDDSDQAASSVIVDSFLLFGLETLTGGQKAFINCTREMLVKGYMALLPKEQVVVEILETVEPDEEIIGACLRLKRAGYLLALDDFVYEDKYEPLLELADIIKVDFQATEAAGRKSLVERMAPRGVKLLAEKVESKQEFEQAVEMGYDYFQGYFFSRPQILSGQDVPGYKLNYLRVLQAVNRPEVNLREIENVIKQDVSLTYKLLRYLNSAFFGFRTQIKSIKHALALLGQEEIKKWTSLVAMASMGEDKPPELVINTIIRAVFCEALAPKLRMQGRETDLFFLGMFSLMDAILERSMSSILAEMPIAEDVKVALLGKDNSFRQVLETVVAYEKGDWGKFSRLAGRLKLHEAVVPEIYLKSVEWTKQIFQN